MDWGSTERETRLRQPEICGLAGRADSPKDVMLRYFGNDGNIGQMTESFSQRHRLAGPPPGTLLRDEVPISFRMFLVNLPHTHVGIEFHELQKVTCEVLQEWPDENLPPYYDYKKHIQKCEWFRIYEIIEGLYRLLCGKDGLYHDDSTSFFKVINEAFVAQNIGWQLDYNGNIVTRGDEVFENTLGIAVDVLGQNNKLTAADHLKSAIRALSERPKANTPGAVSHSTNAVECVLGDLTGIKGLTLGKYLDRYPKLFHPAIKKALNGVYGYASDAGARHGKEGIEPSHEEARFAVATCAAVCTLLTNQPPQP